ncbi:hypothetical protein D3C76_1708250 [compost metagenome]
MSHADVFEMISDFLVFMIKRAVTKMFAVNVAVAAPATPQPSKLPQPKIKNGSRTILTIRPTEKI